MQANTTTCGRTMTGTNTSISSCRDVFLYPRCFAACHLPAWRSELSWVRTNVYLCSAGYEKHETTFTSLQSGRCKRFQHAWRPFFLALWLDRMSLYWPALRDPAIFEFRIEKYTRLLQKKSVKVLLQGFQVAIENDFNTLGGLLGPRCSAASRCIGLSRDI